MFTSLTIREIQIRTVMRYHCTPIRTAKIKNGDNTRRQLVYRKTISESLVGMRNGRATLGNGLAIFYGNKHILMQSNRLLGISPGEIRNLCPHKTCTQIFTGGLFMIAKSWKPPKCPFVGGRMVNRGPSTARVSYPMKRNELGWLSRALRWGRGRPPQFTRPVTPFL